MKVEMRNLMKVETDLPCSKLAESMLNNAHPMLCSERQRVVFYFDDILHGGSVSL